LDARSQGAVGTYVLAAGLGVGEVVADVGEPVPDEFTP
jgi:hypothetical protein